MAALDPVKLIIDNYPEDQTEMLTVANNLENEEMGTRQVPFGRELYIDREDFMEEPPKKYFRLFPGNEVRLMNAYFVTCTGCVKDENGAADIDQSKCVSCGQCMANCPFGAIADKSQIFQVIQSINQGDRVIAAVAPAFVGQFGPDMTPEKLKPSMNP